MKLFEQFITESNHINEVTIDDPNIKEQIGTFYNLQNEIQKLESELSAKRASFKQFEKDVKPLIDGMKEFGDKLAETEGYLIKVSKFGGDRLDVSYKVAFENAVSKVNAATKKVLAEALEASKKITNVKHSFDIHKVSEASFFDKIKNTIKDIISKIIGVFKKEGNIVDNANRDLQKALNESAEEINESVDIKSTYMKHVKLFEDFVKEKKDERYIAYVDDKRKPGGSDKEIKKDYNR